MEKKSASIIPTVLLKKTLVIREITVLSGLDFSNFIKIKEREEKLLIA
jgi:hypothetical protein